MSWSYAHRLSFDCWKVVFVCICICACACVCTCVCMYVFVYVCLLACAMQWRESRSFQMNEGLWENLPDRILYLSTLWMLCRESIYMPLRLTHFLLLSWLLWNIRISIGMFWPAICLCSNTGAQKQGMTAQDVCTIFPGWLMHCKTAWHSITRLQCTVRCDYSVRREMLRVRCRWVNMDGQYSISRKPSLDWVPCMASGDQFWQLTGWRFLDLFATSSWMVSAQVSWQGAGLHEFIIRANNACILQRIRCTTSKWWSNAIANPADFDMCVICCDFLFNMKIITHGNWTFGKTTPCK